MKTITAAGLVLLAGLSTLPQFAFADPSNLTCHSIPQQGVEWTVVVKATQFTAWNVIGTETINGQATSVGFLFPAALDNLQGGGLTLTGLRESVSTGLPEGVLFVAGIQSTTVNGHISADEQDVNSGNTVGRLDVDLVCNPNS